MLRDPTAFKIGEYSEDRTKGLEKLNLEADEALKSIGGSGTLQACTEPID